MSIRKCNRKLVNSTSGFTLVEIIIAIVLVAIVSMVAMSRLVEGNGFNAIIVRDQIISLARTAQQNALGRANVSMTITPNVGSDSVTIVTSYAGGNIGSFTAPLDNVSLAGDINDTASCAVTSGVDAITNTAPLTLTFGEYGDLGVSGVTGSTGAVTSAVRICLNDTASESICVSPSGFAYAGDCDV